MLIEMSLFKSIDNEFRKATSLIEKAATDKGWYLSKNEYNTVCRFNHLLANQGSLNQLQSFAALIQQGWSETQNGTPQHGLFIAIKQHLDGLTTEAIFPDNVGCANRA